MPEQKQSEARKSKARDSEAEKGEAEEAEADEEGEAEEAGAERGEAKRGEAEEPVDLNQASVEELMRIPGISQGWAEKIVEHRGEQGPFSGWEDVDKVPGIGEKNLEKLKAHATLGRGRKSGRRAA